MVSEVLKKFIRDFVPSIEYLEAILLLHNCKHKRWSLKELAKYLYLSYAEVYEIVTQLTTIDVAELINEKLCMYKSNNQVDDLLAELNLYYKTDLIALTQLITTNSEIKELSV